MGGLIKNIFSKKNKQKVDIQEEKNNNLLQDNDWIEDDFEEGQLSVDVYETPKEIIVKSTIAGVKPEDIDISINDDMITIRGHRHIEEKINEDDYLNQECYWGTFSRSIILPTEVKSDKIDASLENGVLTVILPKAKPKKEINIKVKERES